MVKTPLKDTYTKYILPGPTLAIPDPPQKFYINTDWFKYGMGEVLLQADYSVEAGNQESQEKDGGKCEFYMSLKGMRLQPTSFISRSTVSTLEKSRHTFLGEADAVSIDGNYLVTTLFSLW